MPRSSAARGRDGLRAARLWVLLLGGAVVTLSAAENVTVTTLTRDGQVLVSLEMTDAFTDEVRSTIQSGLQTTFEYDVRLRREAAY